MGDVTIQRLSLHGRQQRVERLLEEVADAVQGDATNREGYSTDEVAKILGKQPFTVREWCRLCRINAVKRPTGRGDSNEWEISPDELDRYRNHGLLPLPEKY